MLNSILIFPANIQQALQYLRQTQHQNIKVVGASSLDNDPVSKQYEQWIQLPYITDTKFEHALLQAIEKYHIGGIYTPHMTVWDYLDKLLKKNSSNVALVNSFPFKEEISNFQAAQSFSTCVQQEAHLDASSGIPLPPLSDIEATALFYHAEHIYGQCSNEKLLALCEIVRYAPKGDVVEIGSFCGKSAFILAWLSHRYNIGKLLCVDPWSFEESVDQNEKSGLLSQTAMRIDLDYAKKLFEINLLPYNKKHINYLQMTSVEASKLYDKQLVVSSPAFGTTTYTGKIAILHIDGNHSYQAAKLDVQAWFPKLTHGGLLIIDDYVWPFGDGPQRVGDEVLGEHKENIRAFFVAGGALFIQMK